MAHKGKRLIKFKEYVFFYAKDKQNIKLSPQYKEKYTWDNRYGTWLERNNSNDSSKWTTVSLSQKIKDIGLDIADEDEIIEWKIANAENIIRLAANSSPLIKSTKGSTSIKAFKTPKGLDVYAYNGQKILFASNKIKEIDGEKKLGEYIGDLWTDIAYNNLHNEGGVDLPNGKKPEELINRIINLLIKKDEDAIVLDYHLGCGTTAAVCHKKKIQYIGVEQIDYEKNSSVVRLNNVIKGDNTGISQFIGWQGGGDFIYLELAKWNQVAVEKILKTKSLEELELLFDELYKRYFLNYTVKTKEFKEKIIKDDGFKKLSLDEQKKLFVEMLDMNQMYVNFSERSDKKYDLSTEDIKLSEEFYNFKK